MEIRCPHCQGGLTVPAPDGQDSIPEGDSASDHSGALPPKRRVGELPRGGAAELAEEHQQIEAGSAAQQTASHARPPGDEDEVFAAIARGEIEVFGAREVGKMIVFGCPFCARPVEIKSRQQGGEVRCVECSGLITAPDLAIGAEAIPVSGAGGVAGGASVALPSRRTTEQLSTAAVGEAIPHRLNEEKVAKFVPRDEAEAGFDLESAWTSYPDAKPGARKWGRRLKRLSIVSMLAVMVAALVASVVWIVRSEKGTPKTANGAGDVEEMSPAQRALKVVQGFSRATTVVDRLEFVRNEERVLPRMRRFYGRVQPAVPMPALDALSYQEFEKGGVKFVSMEGVSAPGATRRKILLERSDDGGLLLDWESAVGYCEYDIVSFGSESPPRPVEMRVLVRPSDYYNFEFANENQLVSYQITDLAGRATIFGYAIRGSEAAAEMEKLHPIGAAAGEGSYINCTLILRGSGSPERRQPPQVWIVEVVELDWLVR
jgi:hypothetical protein